MIETRIQEMAIRRRELARRLDAFDANLWLGQPQGFPLAVGCGADALKGAMAGHFIGGGLVSHWRGKTVSPQEGNGALETAGIDWSGTSLHAMWTGLPPYPREGGLLPGPDSLPAHVRAVRVFPKTCGFPLAEWSIGLLVKCLIKQGCPLFIWHTELDWQDLYRLGKAYPQLRIVVESQPRKIIYQIRPLFALMRDCPNVLLEISNLTGPCFESALRCFGPERLIFGSFLPMNDPRVPLGMILDAEMPEADRKLVAGGNLRRIIRGGGQ